MNKTIKKLLFYFIASFALATALYIILWLIMPRHYVFGSLYRMNKYHVGYPISFIAIPCFFFAISATFFTTNFLKKSVKRQVLITALILSITVIVSSPFGGMLWHYYDMKAGFFPENWVEIMLIQGTKWGLQGGWLIVILSIPYNIMISVIFYFLIKKGSELFKT